jgi:hypothetical protein
MQSRSPDPAEDEVQHRCSSALPRWEECPGHAGIEAGPGIARRDHADPVELTEIPARQCASGMGNPL